MNNNFNYSARQILTDIDSSETGTNSFVSETANTLKTYRLGARTIVL